MKEALPLMPGLVGVELTGVGMLLLWDIPFSLTITSLGGVTEAEPEEREEQGEGPWGTFCVILLAVRCLVPEFNGGREPIAKKIIISNQ